MAGSDWLRVEIDDDDELRWSLENAGGLLGQSHGARGVSELLGDSPERVPVVLDRSVTVKAPDARERVIELIERDHPGRINAVVDELPTVKVVVPKSTRLRVISVGEPGAEVVREATAGMTGGAALDLDDWLFSRDSRDIPAADVVITDPVSLHRITAEHRELQGHLALVIGGEASGPSWNIARAGRSILDVAPQDAVDAIREALAGIGHGERTADLAQRVPHLRFGTSPDVLSERIVQDHWREISTQGGGGRFIVPGWAVAQSNQTQSEIDLEKLGEANLELPYRQSGDQPASARRVDVIMLDAMSRLVTREEICGLGETYIVEIGIGRRPEGDLVTGAVDSIDDLLPAADEGHQLEVSLLGPGVSVDGSTTQSIFLPSTGPTLEPARFVVSFTRLGVAHARILVSYRENLVQTFALSVQVESKRRRTRSVVTRVTLQHSQTPNLRVDEIPARACSIVLNSTLSGTHELYIKGGGGAAWTNVDPDKQQKVAETFRDILAESTRLPFNSTLRDPIIRKLATAGRALYRGLFLQRFSDRPRFDLPDVVRASGLVIQITRIDPNHAIPWALIYDRDVPPGDNSIVCYGGKDADHPCSHDFRCGAEGIICCRGFWGVRHQLEESLRRLTSTDETPSIPRTPGHHLVALAIGYPDAEDIEADLKQALPGGQVRRFTPDESLLAAVWSPETRPGIMVVVGECHLDTSQPSFAGPQIAIDTGTAEQQLRQDQLISRRDEYRELDGRPLALILGCESLAADAEALSTLASTLADVGFAGVVGTEIEIYAADIRTFVTAFLAHFCQGPPLATVSAAMTYARQQMITQRNPFGFAFTALAPAGLTLAV